MKKIILTIFLSFLVFLPISTFAIASPTTIVNGTNATITCSSSGNIWVVWDATTGFRQNPYGFDPCTNTTLYSADYYVGVFDLTECAPEDFGDPNPQCATSIFYSSAITSTGFVSTEYFEISPSFTCPIEYTTDDSCTVWMLLTGHYMEIVINVFFVSLLVGLVIKFLSNSKNT